MNRIISLNEVLNKCQKFVDQHPILKDFEYGETSDINVTREMAYPFVWATHNQPSQIIADNRTTIPELNIMFIFMDKVNITNNTTNKREVMSDMFQCVQDLIKDISTNWSSIGIKIGGDASVSPIFDETTDKSAGWYAEVRLKLMYNNC